MKKQTTGRISIALFLPLCFSLSANADECLSKIAIWGNCVPSELVLSVVDESKPNDFIGSVRKIYDETTKNLEIRNSPISDSKQFPGQLLTSMNSGFRSGLFGRDFKKANVGQIQLLNMFCDKQKGKIAPPFVMLPPRSRQKSPYDLTVNVCVSEDGKALAGLATRIALGGVTKSENLFAYYFSGQLIQSIFDFRKNLKPGDKSQFGLVTDIRGRIAQVQLGNGDKWIEIEDLVPFEFNSLDL